MVQVALGNVYSISKWLTLLSTDVSQYGLDPQTQHLPSTQTSGRKVKKKKRHPFRYLVYSNETQS